MIFNWRDDKHNKEKTWMQQEIPKQPIVFKKARNNCAPHMEIIFLSFEPRATSLKDYLKDRD